MKNSPYHTQYAKRRDVIERLVLALHTQELRSVAEQMKIPTDQTVPRDIRLRLAIIEKARADKAGFINCLEFFIV